MQETLDDLRYFLGRHREEGPLKILFVIDHLVNKGGFETYLLETVRSLCKLGHSVYLDYRRLAEEYRKALPSPVILLENYSLPELSALIRKEKIDVIQGQPFYALNRSYTLAQKTNTAYVITWHGRYKMKDAEKYLSAAHRVIAVSAEVRSVLCGQFPPAASKIAVIQNGVNLEHFSPKYAEPPLIQMNSCLKVLFIGRLDADRSESVSILAQVCKSAGYTLAICGEGAHRKKLEQLYGNSVFFCGGVTDTAPLIQNADVVAATGRGCREALAMGKPCIVLSSMGYDGLVLPDNHQRLEYANFSGRSMMQPVDSEGIRRHLKLLENSALREELCRFGRQIANNYDINQTVKKTVLCYRQAIDRKLAPAVSVILPVYNQANELNESLTAILNQTFSDFEVLVIDDCSTDNLMATLDKFSDRRIRFLQNKTNRNLPYSLNRGLLEARGKYLTWTSADNIPEPRYLEVLVKALEKNPHYGAAYTDYIQVRDDGTEIRKLSKGIYRLTGRINFGPSFLYRREAVSRAGFFDERLFGIEDVDYSTRIAIEAPVLWIPEILYKYRVHSNSITARIRNKKVSIAAARTIYKNKWHNLLNTPPAAADNKGVNCWKNEVTLPPQKDCTVLLNRSVNYNASPLLISSGKSEYRFCLKFPLWPVPADVKIVSAHLELFIYRNKNNAQKSVNVFPLEGEWIEDKLHCGNLPAATCKVKLNAVAFPAQCWMNADVTSIVRDWHKKIRPNCGFLLAPGDKTTLPIFIYNRHTPGNLLRPRLRVVYTGENRGAKYHS